MARGKRACNRSSGCQVDLAYLSANPANGPSARADCSAGAERGGYMNLMKLNSCLYLDEGGQLPQVTMEELSALRQA